MSTLSNEELEKWICLECNTSGNTDEICVNCGYEKGYMPPHIEALIADKVAEARKDDYRQLAWDSMSEEGNIQTGRIGSLVKQELKRLDPDKEIYWLYSIDELRKHELQHPTKPESEDK